MAEVTVGIGGRQYRLGCGDGEEDGLEGYAGKMDGIAEAIQRRIGQPIPEGRLLIMVGMTLADELADAEDRIREAERNAEAAKALADSRSAPSDLFNEEVEEALASQINAIADRIEAINARLS
ncbi:MAG: cell division protein ZapA [Pseudomonadota bacterium]